MTPKIKKYNITCVCPMLTPISHANPAEMVVTATTGHVITTLILLNARMTLGTWLGISKDPVRRFGLIAAFLLPSGKFLTCCRCMWFLPTLQTEARLATIARSRPPGIGKHSPTPRSQCNLPTSRTWTPTCHTVRFHEGTELIILKLGEEIRCCFCNLLLRNEFITPRLGTCFPYTRWSLFKGIMDISIPARFTEFMSTWHTNHFIILEAIIIHANFTIFTFGYRNTG